MAYDQNANDVDERGLPIPDDEGVPDGEAARGSGEGVEGVDAPTERIPEATPGQGYEDLQDDLGADPLLTEG